MNSSIIIFYLILNTIGMDLWKEVYMKRLPSIYDFPDVYDAVLRHPQEEIKAEVNSIRNLLVKKNIKKGRVLELACGTCPHGIELAKHGYSIVGIDISQNMLNGAKQRAEEAGVTIELSKDDIIDFNLETNPFDYAIFMSETFPLITGYANIKKHFKAVRQHLLKGGLYIIDIDVHKHGVGTSYNVWGKKTVQLKNGFVEVWHESFPGDWVQGTNHMVMHCRIHLNGEIYETADEWRCRVDSPWNLLVLIKCLTDWSLIGFYSWKDLSTNISHEKHYFMVLE